MIKVLVIDDSAVVRESLSKVLASDPNIEVIGTAGDPLIALKKMELSTPDVITLDIEMPHMDGITFLKQLMETNPIPVVICSSMAEDGSHNAMKALEYGATEIIQKPKLGTKQFIEESRILICDAVKAAALAAYRIKAKFGKRAGAVPQSGTMATTSVANSTFIANSATTPFSAQNTLNSAIPHTIETTEKIVVIGASTGGTEALKSFLEMLPVNAPGIVIVQHMPEHFTRSFAQRLDSLCKVHVEEAKDNDSVIRGKVLIAPGNKHTLLKRSGARYYVEVKDGPLVSRHRPSVDVLFRSAAHYAGKNAVGVIMTGMGDDGAKGMLEMHEAGAYTIAQDKETSVVFGMPAEAIKAGAVDCILPLSGIADEVMRRTL
ncbi:MAG: chemotaxis response regulator protein-glutamate methylesterase [Spirochaetaceae bacterium]|nr:chemotaxis response regulator protein-glutamate methylesterase [Spirochaetaceae bacterium]